MTTTNALGDGLKRPKKAWTGLKLEALQARSASDRASYEVAEYVMKLRTAVTGLAGNRSAPQLSRDVGTETARLVEELREARDDDYWNTRIRPALLKTHP